MNATRGDTAVPPIIDVEVLSSNAPALLASDALAELRHAHGLLTSPGVAVRIANVVGVPIEKGVRMLPARAARIVHYATRAALSQALNVAVYSLGPEDRVSPENQWHKVLAGASGAVGGALGLASMVAELPVSTTLMLRSIAQIAASQGHDLRSLETRLACLEVFALGGDTTADNAAETSYWAVRAALSRLVTEAAGAITGRAAGATPAAVRLVTSLASRFGVYVSEQVAAKLVPILGAATGAAINVVFMDHFQRMAEGHFIVRRLEKEYGSETVRNAYASLGGAPPPLA